MAVVLLSMLFMLLIVGMMSIGVIMGREPLKGSCGGMSALGMDTACDVCGGDAKRCEKNQDGPTRSPDLAYEASIPDENGERA